MINRTEIFSSIVVLLCGLIVLMNYCPSCFGLGERVGIPDDDFYYHKITPYEKVIAPGLKVFTKTKKQIRNRDGNVRDPKTIIQSELWGLVDYEEWELYLSSGKDGDSQAVCIWQKVWSLTRLPPHAEFVPATISIRDV